jgi:hypothetical protein
MPGFANRLTPNSLTRLYFYIKLIYQHMMELDRILGLATAERAKPHGSAR